MMITKKPDIVVDEHLEYLDDLRHQLGRDIRRAGPYLEREFGLTKSAAKEVINYFTESFVERDDSFTAQQDKTVGQDMASDMSTVRYYSLNGNNVARVMNHRYAYLDHKTGEWVRHASVCDSVTGYGGDAGTFEITLEQAKQLARLRGVNVSIEWLPDGD
jgi:hypothetical protein